MGSALTGIGNALRKAALPLALTLAAGLGFGALLTAGVAGGGVIGALCLGLGIGLIVVGLGYGIYSTIGHASTAISGQDAQGNALTPEQRWEEGTYAAIDGGLTIWGGLSAPKAIKGLLGAFGTAKPTAGVGMGEAPAGAAEAEAPAARSLSCFPAGTQVATAEGLRPIESIVAGQRVWAYDLIASQWQLRHVLRAYSRPCEGNAASVTVAEETIESTSRHPYFVVRGEDLEGRPRLEHLAQVPKEATTPGRWVDAADLRVGDELLLRGGRIERIDHVRLYAFFDTVYNFEVEDLHCYAVGWSGVLVHNNNGPEGPVGRNAAPAGEGQAPAGIRTKSLRDFTPTQRVRIQNKLQDIIHVRNGQPAPSGNWSARDGIPFSNREGFLPPSKKGYTEFRVLGKDGKPSGARILINEDNGSVYYSQHYNDDATGFSDITVIWQEMFGT